MLPLAVNQCSVWFTIEQSIVGGLFGSLGFVVNMLVVGFLYKKFKAMQAVHQAQKEATPEARSFINKS